MREIKKLLQDAEALFSYTQTLRRDFHRHPELGFKEVRTAGIVAKELGDLGVEVTAGVAETGVIGLLEMEHAGPTVLLRFDMDALPIQEETGTEYASINPGVMHACGHDAHIAIGLTVARLLNERRSELGGRVKLVFQPAEEGQGGALRMVQEGILENPRPDVALGLHVWNYMPTGWLSVTPGPVMSASEDFRVVLTGKGGHGALPHTAIDPIYAAAQVIVALQSITSRNVSPLDSAVVTVTALHAGEAFNVIPQSAELKGTIRSFTPEVRSLVLERFQQVVAGMAQTLGCQASIDLREVTLAVSNDPSVTARVEQLARLLFPDAEIAKDYRTMGSEDMAYMMQDLPGCYFFLGSSDSGAGLNAPHHHPRFDIDERVLPRAAALIAAAAVDYLRQQGE
jgi:amidohydrolase